MNEEVISETPETKKIEEYLVDLLERHLGALDEIEHLEEVLEDEGI